MNLIRTFWAVAQSGSFSQAAVLLETTQPTVTRQIQLLEQQTGLHLFDRSNRGLIITDAGSRLVESANNFMDSVSALNLKVAGEENVLRGEIRITANEIIGTYLLPPAIKALRDTYPNLQVELDLSNSNRSLTQRDADIAFRMQAPTQAQLVGRKLPNLSLGFYGHKDLVTKQNTSMTVEDFLAQPLIGFDKTDAMINVLNAAGLNVNMRTFDIRCDNLIAQIALIRAGAGFGVIQHKLAERYPELTPIMPEWKIPSLEFWLLSHQDVQYSKTIRLVMSFFGDWFQTDPYSHALS